MKILFMSSEVAPFSSTGGLGEVGGGLPKALKNLGHEVRVITPRYYSIRERQNGIREVLRLKDLQIDACGMTHLCSVKCGTIHNSKVQVYFLDNEEFFKREHYYVDPKTNRDYEDNHKRFAFFAHATLQVLQMLEWCPDVIHCNDWQTGLLPYIIRTNEKYRSAFHATRTVMHIHNMAFQGLFPKEYAHEICLNYYDVYPGSPIEFYDKISFLKAGIATSDALLTVSPNYAVQISTDDIIGAGMQGMLNERNGSLHGIINGVDTEVWNPKLDKKLAKTYKTETMDEGKAENKTALQETFGLPVDKDIPLIAFVARLTEQKGLELIEEAAEEIMTLPAQFVFLGTGEKKYEEFLTNLAKQHPDKVGVKIGYDIDLAHRITAGADIFLMPSKFEPCGLHQMYALIYGTIPIVHNTGGLADTVKDISLYPEDGYGFVFDEFAAEQLLKSLTTALSLFQVKETWKAMQLRGIQADFSWEHSAQAITRVYEDILSKPAWFK